MLMLLMACTVPETTRPAVLDTGVALPSTTTDTGLQEATELEGRAPYDLASLTCDGVATSTFAGSTVWLGALDPPEARVVILFLTDGACFHEEVVEATTNSGAIDQHPPGCAGATVALDASWTVEASTLTMTGLTMCAEASLELVPR
jgi:hypothetical protein